MLTQQKPFLYKKSRNIVWAARLNPFNPLHLNANVKGVKIETVKDPQLNI